MPESCFLGIDVGTSGVKAILVGPTGEVEATAVTALQMSTPHPGWAEQDPEAWWQATLASIRTVLAAKPGARVLSIGISGQMHSSVFLDARGGVIRPALLWCDGRTTAECQEITRCVGGEGRLRDLASNPALEGFTLPKVLWLRNHEPEAFARLATVLLPKDFIRYRLTNALATEPSDASATLMYDTANLRWSTEILDAVGLGQHVECVTLGVDRGFRFGLTGGGGDRPGSGGQAREQGAFVGERVGRRFQPGRGGRVEAVSPCVIDHAGVAAVQRAQQVDGIRKVARGAARRAHRANERVACAAVGVRERGEHAPAAAAAIE